MRILLTGASGFVGAQTLSALLRADVDVVAVSRTRPAVEGDFRWLAADLLDPAVPERLIADARPDAILHLAWTVEHGRFWAAAENLDWAAGTFALVRAAARHGVRRFVGTGTCYEYAWPDDAACSELTTPIVPSLLYGIAKDATRRVVEAYCATAAIEFAWARLFFLYGTGEHPARLVPAVAAALVAGMPARCGSGRGIRDFIDVRDAGSALAALAISNVTGPVNIASGQAVSIAEIAMTLGRLVGRDDLVQLGALPDRAGEPARIVAEVSRLSREVGFTAQWSLERGLSDALQQRKLRTDVARGN